MTRLLVDLLHLELQDRERGPGFDSVASSLYRAILEITYEITAPLLHRGPPVVPQP